LVGATRGGDFEASMLLWSGRADPDGNAPIWLGSKGFTNWGKYISPEIDALFEKGASARTTAERVPFYRQATEIMLRDQPHVVLYHWSMLWGMSSRVQGFKGRPDGLWRPEGLSLSN
jgi:peptide/nickel transport system substrate-binding protein